VRNRIVVFAVLAVLCVAGAVVAAAVAVVGAGHEADRGREALRASRPSAERVLAGRAFLAFRALDRDDSATYTRFSVTALGAGDLPGRAVPAGPSCVRLTFRAGRGLCLAEPGPATFAAIVLDARMRETARIAVPGVPSRSRISPDGRWAGVTAFVSGHSYAQPGQFSTTATIIDLRRGRKLADLEHDFKVFHGRRLVDQRDRNFWGLTFAGDGDTFYATLGIGRRTWLIRGSIRRRTARTLHANVECPSLSPDGKRIGYKKRVGKPGEWRFTVLDLVSGRETRLAEPRSIDDQLEWLDDGHLLYGTGGTVYVVDADGAGAPGVFLADADSPAVVRQ